MSINKEEHAIYICNDCGKEIKQKDIIMYEYDIICSICKNKRDQWKEKTKNNYCPDCGNEIHQLETECRVCKQLKEEGDNGNQ